MAGCDPRPRARALGSGAVALAAALAGAVVAPPVGQAQPAQPAPAAQASDLERARDLYVSAEAAMKDGRFDDAVRDYGASYELSHDPALFYKIGQAHQRAGKCDIALIYYARYLREGTPTEQFAALTRERIVACGGAAGSGSAARTPSTEAGGSAGAGAGAAADAEASASRIFGTAGGAAGRRAATGSDAGDVSTGTAGRRVDGEAAASGSAVPPASAAPTRIPPTREKVGWLLGGGAIALAALGGVLAYAASSSENDVRDLYAGLAGQVPTYDGQTRKRYADLVDQGERYQHLSWAAFGLAGAAAVGVVVLFTVGGDEQPARAPAVAPVVGPRSAGVSVRF